MSDTPDRRLEDLYISYGPMTVEQPYDICPDCYAQRNCAVVLLRMEWVGSGHYFRLPDGERVGPATNGAVWTCLACHWSEVKVR